MSFRERLAFSGILLLVSGCLYQAREHADATVSSLVNHPYDVAPVLPASTSPSGSDRFPPAPTPSQQRSDLSPNKTGWDVQTTAYLQAAPQAEQPTAKPKAKVEPKIPPDLPGAEAKPIPHIPTEEDKETERIRIIRQLFPPLPALPTELKPLPGPEGRPYTLADLHQLAAANSPELRQAASDVEAAKGNLIQARTYPNPTVGWQMQPGNDGSQPSSQGPFFDQVIRTAGKLKLASAAAEMDLRNAELALRRARSDLATRVRNAYYGLLVAKETVRVTRAVARFTDEIYRLHSGLLEAGQVAAYEPMALRAQAYTARLAYVQAIQTYVPAWKLLVATIGLRQLPLSEVSGRVDALIPLYDYDAVLGYALRNHTDVLIAKNGLDKARFNLKLAQVTPVPDVDVNVAFMQEYAIPPKQFTPTATIGIPFPIWDKNKGAIIAAESALVRATEEPHRVELNLTQTLSTAYTGYTTNLQAVDYYRHHILPDQVRTYRGVLDRRQIDLNAAFADLFSAQQTLVGSVTSYVTALGSLWTSVVSVADLLQTDDLFQLAQPQQLPPIPDLEHLLPWPCCHPGGGSPYPAMAPAGSGQAARNSARRTVLAAADVSKPDENGRTQASSSLADGSADGGNERAAALLTESTTELQPKRLDRPRDPLRQAAAMDPRGQVAPVIQTSADFDSIERDSTATHADGERARSAPVAAATALSPTRPPADPSWNVAENPSHAQQADAQPPSVKAQAVKLLDQALEALDKKQYDHAQRLGEQALVLHAVWNKYEYRPEQLLDEVREQRAASFSP